MRNFAVIASSPNPSYDFFAPLTTLMWKHVGKMETLALLTGTQDDWSKGAEGVVLNGLYAAGAAVSFIGPVEGHRPGQVAQSSRQHAAVLRFHEDDVLVTGDIDMWPFQRDWFHQHDPAKWDFTLYYSNAYGEKYPPFHCTPYVAATAKKWREVMELKVTGEVGSQLQANLDRTLGRYHDSWMAWWHDELFYNSKLMAWSGYPSRCQMIPRAGQPPHDRIDRCAWPDVANVDWSKPWVDTHLIRPGATPENWPRIRPILEKFIPSEMGFVDQYVNDYRKARYGNS